MWDWAFSIEVVSTWYWRLWADLPPESVTAGPAADLAIYFSFFLLNWILFVSIPRDFILSINSSGTSSVTVTFIYCVYPSFKRPLAYSNCAIEPAGCFQQEIPTIVSVSLNMFFLKPLCAWPSLTSICSMTSSAEKLPKQLDSAQTSLIVQYLAILSVGSEPSTQKKTVNFIFKTKCYGHQKLSKISSPQLTWTYAAHLACFCQIFDVI